MHAERAVPAGTNFLLGRAKSCRWQVFVRRRPPKQGELRTDVSKATMFQGDRKVTKFFPYFLCFTKSRERPPQGGREAAERQKDLIGLVGSFCLGGLIRGLQNLEASCEKDLILLVGSYCLCALIRGSQNLESSRQGNGLVLFAACKKYRKNTPRVATLWTPGDDSKLCRK